MSKHVLVVGATLLDVKGKPISGLEPATSNPSAIRLTRGGTARNVAENLGRMGADVVLISAVGDDVTGSQLLSQTAESGANLDYTLTIRGQRTGSYIAILEDNGTLSVALDDVRVMEQITPQYLNQNRGLFRDASMIMVDGSLTPAALKTAIRLAQQYRVPLCADPSSTRLAHKLHPYLSSLHLIVPNEAEAAALCQCAFDGSDADRSLKTARQLVNLGVQTVVITLPDYGIDYATSDETGYIPANYAEMVDSTGAGDAVTAAIIFGMLNELPTIECIRLGAAAGSLTLQTADTVVRDLSLDMLYDHLIV